jgi:hypothetical protein
VGKFTIRRAVAYRAFLEDGLLWRDAHRLRNPVLLIWGQLEKFDEFNRLAISFLEGADR